MRYPYELIVGVAFFFLALNPSQAFDGGIQAQSYSVEINGAPTKTCLPGWTLDIDGFCIYPYDCQFHGMANQTHICDISSNDAYSMGTAYAKCCAFLKSPCSVSCPGELHSETLCSKPWHQNTCSFNGICSNGTCQCNPGFTGADCATRVICNEDEFYHKSWIRQPFCNETYAVNLTISIPPQHLKQDCAMNVTAHEFHLDSPPSCEFLHDYLIPKDEFWNYWLNISNHVFVQRQELLDILRDQKDQIQTSDHLVSFLIATEPFLVQLLNEFQQSVQDAISESTGGESNEECVYGNWGGYQPSCPPTGTCDATSQVRVRDLVEGSPKTCNHLFEVRQCALPQRCFECQRGEWSEWTPCPDPDYCVPVRQYRFISRWVTNNNTLSSRCGIFDPEAGSQEFIANDDYGLEYYDDPIDFLDPPNYGNPHFENGYIQRRECPLAPECEYCYTTPWSEWSPCPPPNTCPRGVKRIQVRNIRNTIANCHPPTDPKQLVNWEWCPIDPECDVCHLSTHENYTHWDYFVNKEDSWSSCPDPMLCLRGVASAHQRQLIDANNPVQGTTCDNMTYIKECPVAQACDDLPWNCNIDAYTEYKQCPDAICHGYYQPQFHLQLQDETRRMCHIHLKEEKCPDNNVQCNSEIEGEKTEFPSIFTDEEIGLFDNMTVSRYDFTFTPRKSISTIYHDVQTQRSIMPDPVIGSWGNWTSCPDAICDVGIRARARPIYWPGDWNEVQTMQMVEAEQCPIPFDECFGNSSCAVIEDWQLVGGCEGTCVSGGYQLEKRIHRRLNGDMCNVEFRYSSCELEFCDLTCILGETKWTECLGSCDDGFKIGTAPVLRAAPGCQPQTTWEVCDTGIPCNKNLTCEVTEWSDWSICLANPQAYHEQIRWRSVKKNGDNCPPLVETRRCFEPFRSNMLNITIDWKPCVLSEWQDSGLCTDRGQLQTRSMVTPGTNCGIMLRYVPCMGLVEPDWIHIVMVIFSLALSFMTFYINWSKPRWKHALHLNLIQPVKTFTTRNSRRKKVKVDDDIIDNDQV